VIPLEFIWVLAIAAKMKIHTSLTDIPYAIMDAEALSAIGYSLWDTERDMEKGLMAESSIRALLGKYEHNEMINGYNACVQGHILPKLDVEANVHLLDCTELEVELSNENYEKSSVVKIDGVTRRGYKLSTLRGLTGDGGIIEDIRFGTIKDHDLELSREMILESPMLKPGDDLINDRGFLSREIMNELKTRREVNTYVPLRKNMVSFADAVALAVAENKCYRIPHCLHLARIPHVPALHRNGRRRALVGKIPPGYREKAHPAGQAENGNSLHRPIFRRVSVCGVPASLRLR